MRVRISALIIKNKKLLLVSNDGNWYWTPGGKSEVNEDDVTTLNRELKEELGIILTKSEFYIRYNYSSEKIANYVAPEGEEKDYLVSFSGNIMPSAEVKIAEWFSREEILKLSMLKSFKQIVIEKLIKDGLL